MEPGSEEPRCWWARLETIRENDCNLAAGRYKPTIGTPPPEGDPIELITSLRDDEKTILIGLEKLLAEVEAVQ